MIYSKRKEFTFTVDSFLEGVRGGGGGAGYNNFNKVVAPTSVSASVDRVMNRLQNQRTDSTGRSIVSECRLEK